MRYKAVIFDLDGTLLDTLDDLADSMNAVLSSFGYPVHTTNTYKFFIGHGLRNLIYNSLPEGHKDEYTIDKGFEAMREQYSQRWSCKTHPYDGIAQLLDALTEKHIKMSILSNKADDFTKKIVKEFLSNWHFEAVYGERPNVPRKPDPTSASEISGLLGIKPNSILYLGDSGADMETARNAGMFPVGALWGFREKDELLEHGARELIQSPTELLKFFEE